MLDMTIEAVLVSFALGGIVGAVFAVHLTKIKNEE